ncbi:hypothetical protein EMMF5_002995 [Cystobasidiomycetes sp. EMM_F5]
MRFLITLVAISAFIASASATFFPPSPPQSTTTSKFVCPDDRRSNVADRAPIDSLNVVGVKLICTYKGFTSFVIPRTCTYEILLDGSLILDTDQGQCALKADTVVSQRRKRAARRAAEHAARAPKASIDSYTDNMRAMARVKMARKARA